MPGTDSFGQGVNLALLGDAPDAQQLASDLASGIIPRCAMRFDSATHRGATLIGAAAPQEGMVTYLRDAKRIDYYNGSSWIALTPGPWIPLTFLSGYVAYSGAPSYRIVNNTVELRGAVQNTGGTPLTSGTHLFVALLPVEARPPFYRYFPIATAWQSTLLARCEIEPAGNIKIAIPTPPAGGTSPEWASLDGVSFSLG